jgi:acetyl-CoA synthetase
MTTPTSKIESLQAEGRIFHPPNGFAESAHITSMEELEALRSEAAADPEKFCARFAETELHWF